ncbi:hypothetical protein F4680DRAFT_468502 [Xylaria scruposa]|nr:hypothetical protein F4680DRAFT_468502 [Xylaria scruposa]
MEYEIAAKTLFTVHSYEADLFRIPKNLKFVVEEKEEEFAIDQLADSQRSLSDDNDRSLTPAPEIKASFCMQITMNSVHDMAESQSGFVFGGGQDVCDVLLDKDQGRGVSRKQFAIIQDWDLGILTLKNLSRRGTHIKSQLLGHIRLLEVLKLQENETVTVKLGVFDIEIRIPNHSGHRDIFLKNWSEHRARLSSKLPVLQKLAIKSSTKTGRTLETDYVLDATIGRGAQATVYSAKDRKSGDDCAVKQFHTFGRYNEREVKIISKLKHPHVIRFISANEYQGKQVVAMELGGRDLQYTMQNEPLDNVELQTGLKQLFDAVAYIHGKNVTHRDIKPANVIVHSRTPMCLKFTDFGLANKSDHLKSFVGTPRYVAPELKDDGSLYTDKVDIWSMGIMALDCFYGLPDPPKNCGLKDPRWYKCVQNYLASLYPQDVIWSFVNSLLQLDPKCRPSAKQAMEHRFFSESLEPTLLSGDIESDLSTIPFDPPLQEDDTRVTGIKRARKSPITTNSPPRTVIHSPDYYVSSDEGSTIIQTEAGPSTRAVPSPSHHESASHDLTTIIRVDEHPVEEVSRPTHYKNESREAPGTSLATYHSARSIRYPHSTSASHVPHDESLISTASWPNSHRSEESGEIGQEKLPAVTKQDEDSRLLSYDHAAQLGSDSVVTEPASFENRPLSMSHWSLPAFPGSNNDRIGLGPIRMPQSVDNATVIASRMNKSRSYDSVTGSIVSTTSGPPGTPTSYRRSGSNSSVATNDHQKFCSESRENHGALDDIPEDSVWGPYDPALVQTAPTPRGYESMEEDIVDIDGSREWPPTPGRVEDPEPEAISIQRMPTPGTSGMNYAIIGGKRVNVRMSDSHVNANEICFAAGLDAKRSRKYLLLMKKFAAPPLEDGDIWVPLQKGIELCRMLRNSEIEEQLSQISQISQPPQQQVIPSIEADNEPIDLGATRKRKRRSRIHN